MIKKVYYITHTRGPFGHPNGIVELDVIGETKKLWKTERGSKSIVGNSKEHYKQYYKDSCHMSLNDALDKFIDKIEDYITGLHEEIREQDFLRLTAYSLRINNRK